MPTKVTIRESFKLIDARNKLSGHQWIEHGETTHYHVIGAIGLHSKHRTLLAAQKESKKLQDFYNKFNL